VPWNYFLAKIYLKDTIVDMVAKGMTFDKVIEDYRDVGFHKEFLANFDINIGFEAIKDAMLMFSKAHDNYMCFVWVLQYNI